MTQKKSMEISHMKKTLLAAALMVGFAGVAQAETSVTLYGVVDGGIGYERLKGSYASAGNVDNYYAHNRGNSVTDTRTGLLSGVQSGNRWGLRGYEDVCDVLRFFSRIECGFDVIL